METEEENETAGGGGGGGLGGSDRCGQKMRGYWKKEVQERYQEAQRPEGATPGRSPPRLRTRQEWEAAMGRNHRKGGGLPASGKTRPEIPQE